MKNKCLILSAALALLLSACASLPEQKGPSIDALIKAAGIDNQLNSLRNPIPPKSIEAPGIMLPEDVIHSVNAAVASTLKPDAIHADIKNNLDKNMSAQQIAEALAFYQSPEGLEVVAVEAGQPGSNAAGKTPQEQQEVAELDHATHSSEIVSNLAEQSISSALDYATDKGCFGLDKDRFAGYLAGVVKKAVLRAVRDGIRESLDHQYDTLSPSALDAYLHFAQSPTGQQFFSARNEAISNNLMTASSMLSAALVEQVSENCKGS